MFPILNKHILGKGIKRIDILADRVAKTIQAGQFVIIVPDEGDHWIPMNVAETDARRGIISIVFRETGDATKRLGAFAISDSLYAVFGPLGRPSTIEKVGVVVCVTAGVGAAQILPVCRAFKAAGNKVIGIVGLKTKDEAMLEAQMRLACTRQYIVTEDGSKDRRGRATDMLREQIDKEDVRLVYAIGSAKLLEAVAEMTRPRKIKTLVHLNPPMHCGIGICNACRVKVGKDVVLSCIDGPEADAHQVDFKDYRMRLEGCGVYEEGSPYDFTTRGKKEKVSISKVFRGIFSSKKS